MAAGIVYHDITTASGVTFSIACWVPDTAAPDVGAIPVSVPINSSGVPIGGDATNGLDVDVTRVPALVAGSARIGTVGLHDGANALTFAQNEPDTNAYAIPVIIHPDSQLPAVANNADAVAAAADLFNQATVSYLYGYNGTTFDRLQVDAAKNLKTAVQAPAVGGLTPFYTSDLDEAKQQIKGSAGGMFNMIFTNRTTGALWIHFYDALSASVTVGTTTPTFQIEVPANASDHTMAMPNFNPHGLNFATGITVACTTAQAGTGAPSAGALAFFAAYK